MAVDGYIVAHHIDCCQWEGHAGTEVRHRAHGRLLHAHHVEPAVDRRGGGRGGGVRGPRRPGPPPAALARGERGQRCAAATWRDRSGAPNPRSPITRGSWPRPACSRASAGGSGPGGRSTARPSNRCGACWAGERERGGVDGSGSRSRRSAGRVGRRCPGSRDGAPRPRGSRRDAGRAPGRLEARLGLRDAGSRRLGGRGPAPRGPGAGGRTGRHPLRGGRWRAVGAGVGAVGPRCRAGGPPPVGPARRRRRALCLDLRPAHGEDDEQDEPDHSDEHPGPEGPEPGPRVGEGRLDRRPHEHPQGRCRDVNLVGSRSRRVELQLCSVLRPPTA